MQNINLLQRNASREQVNLHYRTLESWLKTWMLRPETLKLLEENIGSKLLDIGPGDDFLDLIQKAKATKAKKKWVGLYKTKTLMHSKENYQQDEKTTYWIRENVCKSFIW